MEARYVISFSGPPCAGVSVAGPWMLTIRTLSRFTSCEIDQILEMNLIVEHNGDQHGAWFRELPYEPCSKLLEKDVLHLLFGKHYGKHVKTSMNVLCCVYTCKVLT